jgi:hypothetical protein
MRSFHIDINDIIAESSCLGLAVHAREVVCGLHSSEKSQASNLRQSDTDKLDLTSLHLPFQERNYVRS